jgi:hypothetical protein
MPAFLDTESRNWDLRVDVDAIRRVRAAHNIDLATVLANQGSIERLTSDIVLTIDVIFELVRPAASRLGVSAEDFGKALAGDALGNAISAFEEALVDFLPESNRRALARRILQAGKAIHTQKGMRIDKAIKDGLLEAAIKEQLDKLDETLAKAMKTGTATGQPSSD